MKAGREESNAWIRRVLELRTEELRREGMTFLSDELPREACARVKKQVMQEWLQEDWDAEAATGGCGAGAHEGRLAEPRHGQLLPHSDVQQVHLYSKLSSNP